MPMFYFHLSNEHAVGDTDGTNLPDIDAAWTHALTVAGELKSHSSGMLGHPWSDLTMSACDAAGTELFSFPMSHVIANEEETALRSGKGWTLDRHRRN
jgi:hypothetical protein